ncbi:hypothetical protein Sjap_008545 [Stephania japonica]|uniref:Ribonuclease H1 N-terminal domain-containing protein n=1 Tax=Stephania japonica TaxID=461633 RepID=A0AAP0PEJ8_9MAGN
MRDAITRRNGLKVRNGTYYLVDTGYSNNYGFLTPFHCQRQHLSEWATGKRPAQTPVEVFNMPHVPDDVLENLVPEGQELGAKDDASNEQPENMGSKSYIVYFGWVTDVYGTWYECYKQLKNFDSYYYKHFDTKDEAIAKFYSWTGGKIRVEVPPQLTLKEAIVVTRLDEISPPPFPQATGSKTCDRLHHLHTMKALICGHEILLFI